MSDLNEELIDGSDPADEGDYWCPTCKRYGDQCECDPDEDLPQNIRAHREGLNLPTGNVDK